jgi:uncharacterized metal-binding protein
MYYLVDESDFADWECATYCRAVVHDALAEVYSICCKRAGVKTEGDTCKENQILEFEHPSRRLPKS